LHVGVNVFFKSEFLVIHQSSNSGTSTSLLKTNLSEKNPVDAPFRPAYNPLRTLLTRNYLGLELDMPVLSQILFTLLILAPILLAWLKGDQILDRMAARRKRQQRRRRRKTTRALPLREDAVQLILESEDRSDKIDSKIAGALGSYQSHYSQGREKDGTLLPLLSETEHLLLSRESHFNSYLDIAWLQSETIEILAKEVTLLRKVAQLGPHQHQPSAPAPAANHLVENLEAAIRKRADVDRKLDAVGRELPKHGTDSRFDTTVG